MLPRSLHLRHQFLPLSFASVFSLVALFLKALTFFTHKLVRRCSKRLQASLLFPPKNWKARSLQIDMPPICSQIPDLHGPLLSFLPAITWNWHVVCSIGRRTSRLRYQVTTRTSGGTLNFSN